MPPTASLVTGLSIATGCARACVCACAGGGGVLSLLNPGGGCRRTLGAWNTGVRSRMEGRLPRCWGYRGGRGLRAPGGAGQGRGPGHTPWPGLGHRDTARRALAAGVLQLRSPAPGPQGRWCGPHVFAATQRCLASRVSTAGRLEPRSQAHLGPGRGAAGAGLTHRLAEPRRSLPWKRNGREVPTLGDAGRASPQDATSAAPQHAAGGVHGPRIFSPPPPAATAGCARPAWLGGKRTKGRPGCPWPCLASPLTAA